MFGRTAAKQHADADFWAHGISGKGIVEAMGKASRSSSKGAA
jgi:hypothetical protein